MLHPSRTVVGKDVLLPGAAAASLALGGALTLAGVHTPAHAIWAAVTIALLVPLSVSVVRSLVHGDVGVDAIALLAMAGALALGEAAWIRAAGLLVAAGALVFAASLARVIHHLMPCAGRATVAPVRRVGAA